MPMWTLAMALLFDAVTLWDVVAAAYLAGLVVIAVLAVTRHARLVEMHLEIAGPHARSPWVLLGFATSFTLCTLLWPLTVPVVWWLQRGEQKGAD